MSSGFICHGRVEYGWRDKLLKLSPAAFAAFRAGVGSAYPEMPKTQDKFDEKSEYGVNGWTSEIMDSDVVQAWTDAGIDVSVSRIKGLASQSQNPANTIYQISVANIGIMQITCVEVLEDCCTDALQQRLDEGWRILAVCPPNDTRRPSYVMGHFDKEKTR